MKNLFIIILSAFLFSPPAFAKFKCWTNNEGVKECGSYVPPEYSQKRIETRGKSGRVTEIKERAKTKDEIAEINRLKELEAIEDKRRAEQKKKDEILLKTFTRERDINMLRDSKVSVLEGIITVTKSNNKALQKKLEKLQKKAANIERRGNKLPENLVEDIKTIEKRINKNEKSIASKREEQKEIKEKFAKDLKRFHDLKGKRRP